MEFGGAIEAAATPAADGGGTIDGGGEGGATDDTAAEGTTGGGEGEAVALRATLGEAGACSTGRCPLLARSRAIRSSGVSSAMGHLRSRP